MTRVIYQSSAYDQRLVVRRTVAKRLKGYNCFEINKNGFTLKQTQISGDAIPQSIRKAADELWGSWPNQVEWPFDAK